MLVDGVTVWPSDVAPIDPVTGQEAHLDMVQMAQDMHDEYKSKGYTEHYKYPKPEHWKFR